MNEMKFDGVSFNVEVVREMSKKEFINHPMHNNHWRNLSPDEKKQVAAQAYKTMVGETEKPPSVPQKDIPNEKL